MQHLLVQDSKLPLTSQLIVKKVHAALSSDLKGQLLPQLTLGAFLASLCSAEAKMEQEYDNLAAGNSPAAGQGTSQTSPGKHKGGKSKGKSAVVEANLYPFSRRAMHAGAFDVVMHCIRKAILVGVVVMKAPPVAMS